MDKVQKFFQNYKKQDFKTGDILIRAGEEPAGVFYLDTGVVRQYYISKNGNELTLNMFKPKSFFPMFWAVGDIRNTYYFEAMIDCTVYRAPKNEVLQFLKDEPDVLFDLLKRVYIGVEGVWLHMEQLSTGSANMKLAATILTLGRRFGKMGPDGLVIQLKMTEKALGEYTGMYRETVSREFSKLREKKFVSYTGGIITIPDMQKLEELLEL